MTPHIAENRRVTLHAGGTALRDASGLDTGFRMAVEPGLIAGPRLPVSLSTLSQAGGIDTPRPSSGVDLGMSTNAGSASGKSGTRARMW